MAGVVGKASTLGAELLTQAGPKLKTFLYYAKVELVPPKPNEIGQVLSGIRNVVAAAKNGSWKNLTVRQAWLNTLVAIEAGCWFYVGECIGKRHIVGYDV